MARDRKACDKAIREAWKRERELVLAGKGTRDWDEEQQLEIIELGKVYDDDGVAFEGQHMKSVATHPEHQGNPDNIQLLSVSEHLDAHKGKWQNPTNWYYSPDVSPDAPENIRYKDFGDADPEAPAPIELSSPIAVERKNITDGVSNGVNEGNKGKKAPDKKVTENPSAPERKPVAAQAATNKPVKEKGLVGKIIDGVKYYGGKGVRWVKEHPWETVGAVAGTVNTIFAVRGTIKRYKHTSTTKQIPRPVRKPTVQKPTIQKPTIQKPTMQKRRIDDELVKKTVADIGGRLGEGLQHSSGLSETVGQQLIEHGSSIANSLSDCSKLFTMGYTTKKSPEERRKILEAFVSAEGVEKARKYLQFLINTRKGMKNGIYENAVAKWLEDLEYITGK